MSRTAGMTQDSYKAVAVTTITRHLSSAQGRILI